MSVMLEVNHIETLAELLERLGDIPPDRILIQPLPGLATEEDLFALPNELQKSFELVDGVLVEKAMGYAESALAAFLIMRLGRFIEDVRMPAVILGADGHTRFLGKQIRMPDVSVILRSRLPQGRVGDNRVGEVAPDLAVEILSPGNTTAEIQRKLHEYFGSGVRLVWIADPRQRTVLVYISPVNAITLCDQDTLTGGDVLPGFELSIQEWFDTIS